MKTKRFLRITLIIMMVMLSTYIISTSTSAEIYEGECGPQQHWTFNSETGVLEIKGKHQLYDYSKTPAPWAPYGEQVKELILPSISYDDENPMAFVTLKNCEKVTLSEDAYYYYVEKNCVIEKGTNKLLLGFKNSVIPQQVTEIGEYAFYGRTITDLTIPSNVTHIGNYAFSSCNELTSISLTSRLTSIGDYAFSGCTKLESLDIPDSVCLIGEYAFSGCGIKTLDLPASISFIPANCFNICSKLTEINIPDNIKFIDNYAFENCWNLKSVTMENGVTVLGNGAFSRCTALENLKLSNSLTTISNECFVYCESLKSVTIPDSVTTIGKNAFYYCKSLEDVTLSKNLTKIPENCFLSCESLKSITISGKVSSIGNKAFYNCTSLKEVTMPDSVTTIGESAFYSCKALENIKLSKKLTAIPKECFKYCENLKEITMTNSVLSIGESAFYYCSALANIKFSNNITEIPGECFAYCKSLTTVTLPNKVTAIRTHSFYGCTNLKALNLPNSIATIEDGAVIACNVLTEVYIPKSVSKLYVRSFDGDVKLTISPDNPYYYQEKNCIIEKNTKTLLIAYKDAVIPDDGSVTVIGEFAFTYSDWDGEIIIPDTITHIEKCAFEGAYINITKVTLSKNLKSIGADAFYHSQFEEIVIPEGVTYIGDNAFGTCQKLVSVQLPNSIEELGVTVFMGCESLEKVNFPENLTEIPDGTFFGCESLKEFTIPKSVKTIGYRAFKSTSLEVIDIPEGIERIEDDAFHQCVSAKTLMIPQSVIHIGENLFGSSENYQFELESVILPKNVDLKLYPNTIRELSVMATIYIDTEEIARDPAKYALLNSGSVNNLALPKEYAPDTPWCIFYDKAEDTITYGGKEYVLFTLNENSRAGYKETLYHFENKTGHWISNNKKESHTFSSCPGICSKCNYTVKTDTHCESYTVGKDNEHHWKKCTVCPDGHDIWDIKDHTWDEGKVTREPTVEAVGKIWHKCLDCGFNKVFDIPQLTPEPTPTPTPDETEVTVVPSTPEVTPSVTPPEETDEPPVNTQKPHNQTLTIIIIVSVVLLITTIALILPMMKRKK